MLMTSMSCEAVTAADRLFPDDGSPRAGILEYNKCVAERGNR